MNLIGGTSLSSTDHSPSAMNDDDDSSSYDAMMMTTCDARNVADSTTSTYTIAFQEGEDVLWRSQDGFHYLGVVVEVELDSASCLIRFGDCTEKWTHFGDIRRLSDEEPASPESQETTEMKTPLPLVPKFCASLLSPMSMSSVGLVPEHVSRARKELPYDFDSLLWDENHQRNDKERYCYCGESGDWYRKMLQCNRCLQWFHQDCTRVSHTSPLLLGDRFFDFVCTLCTGTCEEILQRIDLTMTDALQLTLFNLTVQNSKKFHNLESAIIPFIRTKWKSLQGPSNILKLSRLDPQYLYTILSSNKSRFKSGSEFKRSTFWGLRTMAPPLPSSLASRLTSSTSSNMSGSGGHDVPHNNYNKISKRKVFNVPTSAGAVRKTAGSFQQKKDFLQRSNGGGRGSKRGRPPRFKVPRDSFDSCTSSDVSSSSLRGSLDLFIPPPMDFEGFNNPFRDVDNCFRDQCYKTFFAVIVNYGKILRLNLHQLEII